MDDDLDDVVAPRGDHAPPLHVLAALRDELPVPLRRHSQARLAAIAREICRERSAVGFETGNHTMVPVPVLVSLRTPREFQVLVLRKRAAARLRPNHKAD
jgi:hypothetical protein